MKAYFLLKQNGLFVFLPKNQVQQLLFPPDVVRHQEVIDQKLFEQLLREFFSHFSKGDSILFLSQELVFSKTVQNTPEFVYEDEVKKFIEMVPLSSNSVEEKIIQTKQAIFFMATNSNLYKTIIAIGQQYGCHIKEVVPLTLFNQLLQGQTLSFDTFSCLAKEKSTIEIGDFLHPTKLSQPKKQMPRKQILLLVVCFLCLGGVFFFAAINLGFVSRPSLSSSNAKVTPILSSKPTQSALTPQISENNESATPKKTDIKIQVLNGSGIAGQANTVKSQLTDAGFTSISTGNAAGSPAKITFITFSKRTPVEFRDVILAELKKTFTDVNTQQDPLLETYDVSITTGEAK